MKVLIFLLVVLGFSLAQNVPQPFGLKLGESTKEEVERVVEKEGGKITERGYRVIKGDIANPNVEGFYVVGLPVDNLQIQEATFWFYKGRLFKIVCNFQSSIRNEEFYVLYEKLEAKYGKPRKYIPSIKFVTRWDGIAEWSFGNVRISLVNPSVFGGVHLTYEHIPLSKQADQSDQEETCLNLVRAGNYARAIKLGQQLVNRNPRSYGAHFCLARGYYEVGDFRKSLEHAKKMEELASSKEDLALA